MNKEDYLHKLNAQLDEWKAYLAGLEAKAREAKADAKIRYEKEISSIRERMHELQQKTVEIRAANASAWEELKHGAQEAWNRLRDAVSHAKSKFK